jgi:hypothetical protein
MTKVWILITALFVFVFWTQAKGGDWNDKPVMCEQKEIALGVVKAKGESPLITAVQSTKVHGEDGLSDIPVHTPLQIFVNFKTKTFSILEFHPSYNSICVIAYGDNWTRLGEQS